MHALCRSILVCFVPSWQKGSVDLVAWIYFGQMWIEIAEESILASQPMVAYTRARKQFTMIRPFSVKGVDYESGPLSGGTEVLISGEVCSLFAL